MATLLRSLQSRAASAQGLVSKHGSSYYKQLLERNKQYIVGDASVEKCQELSKQFVYTNLASIPKRYESALKELEYLKARGSKISDIKVEELGIGVLFAAEVYAWFCVGEIIGRGGTLTGYKV
eukprot:jgi/Mesen1/4436/ME000225S03423